MNLNFDILYPKLMRKYERVILENLILTQNTYYTFFSTCNIK